ncbi:uncharacterized protein LOC121386714 [Gigantopelta aegis]|uniref:uncharacterized protein LOC121386714 n=1 Tax=Gigantopelta aegis TaxID=1735272 RepID=UPI001B8888F5|nr:uncharacterized protein LOC121386714 [Gigantopelta aegis]
MMRNLCLMWLYLLILSSSNTSCGASILTLSKSMAVIGQPLVLKYENMMTVSKRVTFYVGRAIQGGCEAISITNGICDFGYRYNVTRISSNVLTLEIPSFDATVNAGSWRVEEGQGFFSNVLDLTTPFGTIVTTSSINIKNSFPLQEQINSKKDFNVSTVIDCAFPSVNVSWVFGDSQTLPPVITTDDTECDSPLVKTIAVLTMNGKSMTGHVNVSVRLIHPSFENGNEVLDILIGAADFPVALTSVSISTKPAMIEAGVATVLQCVTNPAFPIATIMWILDNTNITQGVTSTTERVHDSGFITTSNLTKTYASKDDGKTLVCSATNGEYTVSSPVFQLRITGRLLEVPYTVKPLKTGPS